MNLSLLSLPPYRQRLWVLLFGSVRTVVGTRSSIVSLHAVHFTPTAAYEQLYETKSNVADRAKLKYRFWILTGKMKKCDVSVP